MISALIRHSFCSLEALLVKALKAMERREEEIWTKYYSTLVQNITFGVE